MRELVALLGLPEAGPLMIALVGAGGKTTTMLALAREYRTLNRSVLVTTTTRIYVPAEDARDRLLLGFQSPALECGGAAGTVTVLGEAVEDTGKLVGVAPERLDALFQNHGFDVILVEADGSRGKPLKAPAAYEPVIPSACTHVVGVIGMDAFGQPVQDNRIHRLPEFMAATGSVPGQRIDEGILTALIASPSGLFKNVPDQARRILLLNKCEATGQSDAAISLIKACLRQGAGRLTLGAWQ